MLSTMAEQKFEKSDSSSINGFLHDVTQIKTSRNNTRYFNAVLQHKETFHRLVCFTPEKQATFASAADMASPVKLTNIQRVPSLQEAGGIDIKFNKTSDLNMEETVPFKRRKLNFTEPTPQTLEQLRIAHQNVTINAKVIMFIEDAEEIEIYGKKTSKAEVLIADSTKACILTVWGENIKEIKVNESYNFANVSTRKFNEEIKVTTTPRTTIINIAPLTNVVEDKSISLKKFSEFVGLILAVSILVTKKCSCCFKTIPETEIGKTITKCIHCSMKQKTSSLLTTMQARMNFQSESTTTRLALALFEGPLKLFLTKNNQAQLLQAPEDLEDYLLSQPQLKLLCNNDVVQEIAPI